MSTALTRGVPSGAGEGAGAKAQGDEEAVGETVGSEPTEVGSDEPAAAAAATGGLAAERDRLYAAVLALCASAARVDVAQVVRDVTTLALSLTRADAAMFVPAEPSGLGLPRLSFQQPPLGGVLNLPDVPRLSEVLWRGEPARIDDLGEEGQQVDGLCAGTQPGPTGAGTSTGEAAGARLRSWLGVPVKARYGDILGALFVGGAKPEAFGAREVEVSEALAGYLGARFESLSLSLERAHVAGALQQTLLPPALPTIPGLDVAARYRPAKSVARVGGDFYDIFELGEGAWGLIVGDVSGVGPEAASLTGVARYGARAVASGEHSPAELLRQLNDTLFRLRLREKFCTLLYAQVRPEAGNVRIALANGGHPYPFVLRSNGQVEQVEVRGMLLGVFDELDLEERETCLGPGDVAVFYTDGVIEAHGGPNGFFGTEGLVRALCASTLTSAGAVARSIELAVLDHEAGGSRDDMAVVVVRNPAGAS
jgi:serine phosphatase RsbU (regulator of sigma subunit)